MRLRENLDEQYPVYDIGVRLMYLCGKFGRRSEFGEEELMRREAFDSVYPNLQWMYYMNLWLEVIEDSTIVFTSKYIYICTIDQLC